MGKPNTSAIVAASGHMSSIWISLVRGVAKHGGTDEDIIRLNAPEGEDTLDQIAELIASANRKTVELVQRQPLLKLLGTVAIPATTEKFVVKDRFTTGTLLGIFSKKDVKISDVGGNFKSWFSDKVEEPSGATELRQHQLLQSSVDGPIIAELGGEEKAETMLAQVYSLMEKQGKGQSGTLLSNGYANIFYVRDTENLLREVRVIWDDVGWRVDAGSVERLIAWLDGPQVFSRNSDH